MENNSHIHIRPALNSDKNFIRDEMRRWWGDELVIINGEKIFPADYDGFIAELNGESVGLVILRFTDSLCEIISLTTVKKYPSVGKSLIVAAIDQARKNGLQKLIAVTTNDNIDAFRFYQQMGFTICNWRKGAIEQARKIKPQIPIEGNYHISIRDEIELE